MFTDEILIAEIERNLAKVLAVKTWSEIALIQQIEAATTKIKTVPLFTNCPDEKDNFLFDLALQTGSEIIVTKEKALLYWEKSPLAIHDIKWFKEKYKVD